MAYLHLLHSHRHPLNSITGLGLPRFLKTSVKLATTDKWTLTFCWPCISVYLSQYLTNLMHKILFHSNFISCLYVFRTRAHHQEVKIALHSLWYHHTYRCEDTRGCVMQFWPPDDEHMCSKHVQAWNKTYCETKFCASSLLNTEIKKDEWTFTEHWK